MAILMVVIGFSAVETIDPEETRHICNMQITCATCIGADVKCTWCYDNLYSKPRCDQRERHIKQGCNDNWILSPVHKINLAQNEPLTDNKADKVLIKPQKIRLQIRPHETATIPIKFHTTKDFSIDMYFLMDLSHTMSRHIEELSRVSMDLVKSMRNLTGSLQVGIGSFVDKLVLPFGYCKKSDAMCGHSFVQQVKLTNKFTQFTDTVSRLKNMTTSNIDIPEGGMDALMQTIVCGNKIGWRKNSRKLIIYCSDTSFHFAGDGHMGGIVLPNDGECHMDSGEDTKEYIQDYPSLQHLAQKLQKNKFTVIFAIAGKEYQPLYNLLSQSLMSSYVSELGNQNSTIANIVTEGYKNISSTIEMKADTDNFKVHFRTNCTNGGQWIRSEKCYNVKLGETVDFQAVITAPECPKGNQSDQIHTISIHPVNSNSQLQIDVQLICKCDCEEKEPHSQMCNNNGMLHCGECVCYEGFSGQRCECNATNKDVIQNCIMPNSTIECSGRGSCECGRCICHSMASNRKQFYSGTYCECDDYSCPNYNGLLCGGSSRGVCECGVCQCTTAYTGEDCHCPTSIKTCIAKNNKTCNGYGQCECGVCTCDVNSGFIGNTCDYCPTCNNWCEIHKECIKCWMSKESENNNKLECSRLCKTDSVQMVDSMMTEDGFTVCKVEIDKCIIYYQTVFQNDTQQILIRRKKDCPESKTTILVIGIVSGILLLGLVILIIWKVITTIFDRRELARFNEEKATAAWTTQTNPLFIQSSTTYENPTWVLNG